MKHSFLYTLLISVTYFSNYLKRRTVRLGTYHLSNRVKAALILAPCKIKIKISAKQPE